MRRLYLQVYAMAVGILLIFGILSLILWWLHGAHSQDHLPLRGLADLLEASIPPHEALREELLSAGEMIETLAQDLERTVT